VSKAKVWPKCTRAYIIYPTEDDLWTLRGARTPLRGYFFIFFPPVRSVYARRSPVFFFFFFYNDVPYLYMYKQIYLNQHVLFLFVFVPRVQQRARSKTTVLYWSLAFREQISVRVPTAVLLKSSWFVSPRDLWIQTKGENE
jgi:hypothetical protein